MQKICVLCGKEFETKVYNRSVCYEDHYHPCPVCGKPVLSNDPNRQNSCCSRKCGYELAKLSRDKSVMEKYGVDNVSKLNEVRSKISRVAKENQYPHTCRVCGKHFTSNATVADVCSDIHYSTCVVCGKKFILTEPYNQKTCSSTCRGKYIKSSGIGKANAAKSRVTLQSRYGVDNCMHIPEVKAKVLQTTMQRYGVEHPLQNPDMLEKSQNTCESNYGVRHPAQHPDVLRKMAETTMQRYGVENYFSLSEHVQNMMSDPEKYEDWISFKEDPAAYISKHYKDTPSADQLCLDLGVSNTVVYNQLIEHGVRDLVTYRVSNMEQEVYDFIHDVVLSATIVRQDRTQIRPYELDIWLPDFKFAIECNPSWTHNSSIPDPWGCACKPHDYHAMKSQMCANIGVRLFHIFGYEWKYKRPIIESMIRNALNQSLYKVYARHTTVKEVDMLTTKQFLNENHRQGYCSYKYSIGLYQNDQLVSLMTFGRLRNSMGRTSFTGDDTFELLRFCNKLNHVVVGGASKLLKYFVNHFDEVRKLVSFSDVAHTSGNLYKTLGFVEVSTSNPNYVWVNPKTEQYFTRVACQKQNLPKLFNEPNLDIQNQTEKQIMEAHGYVQVFDSGTIRWEYTCS